MWAADKSKAAVAPTGLADVAEVALDVPRTETLLKTGALQSAIFNSANFSSIATDASDLIMPESDGPPLFDRLRQMHPRARVLYISGYADDAVVRHGVIVEGTPFLQKPFTPLALSGKIREVLDSPCVMPDLAPGRPSSTGHDPLSTPS